MPDKANETAENKQVAPTRDKILAAAFQLFIRHGYDGTSLNQIVGASGVSKGAYYHYFPSKFNVYQEVIETFFLTPFQSVNKNELAKLPPKKARAIVRQHYANLPDQISAVTDQGMGRVFALMFDGFSRLPDFHIKIAKVYTGLLKALARSFAQSKSPSKKHKRAAWKFLANLEGEIFLNTLIETS